MFFEKRLQQIYKCESVDELVEKLIEYTWTLCTVFQLDDLLFVNDSSSEDGAQEYAVLKIIPHDPMFGDGPTRNGIRLVNGKKIESLTVSWMKPDRLREIVEDLLEDSDADFYGLASIHVHGDMDPCFNCQ